MKYFFVFLSSLLLFTVVTHAQDEPLVFEDAKKIGIVDKVVSERQNVHEKNEKK